MGNGVTDDHFYDVGDCLTPHLCFISRPSHVGDCPLRSFSDLMPHSSDVANQSIQHCSDVGDGAIPQSLLKPHIDLDHGHGHGHGHDDGLVEHSDNSGHESSRSFFHDACHNNTDLALLCPRISFSLEGVISKQEEDEHHYIAGINARVCEEEESREWRGGTEEDKSEDFEFSNNHEALGYSDLGGSSSSSSSSSCSSNCLSMLPADELFSNGKLIPLGSHQRTWSLPSSCATSSFLSQDVHESHANMKAKPQERASLARHLSLDMSKHSCSLPSSSSLSLSSNKGFKLSQSVENFPCSSPQRLLLGPSQYSSNIIMHFVKPNLESEKTTFASSKSWRMPIHTPRSFWPFSRSNSSRLVDKKIKCIIHSTPPRSIVSSSSPPCNNNNNNIRWTPKKIYTTSEEENMMPWEGPRIRRGVEKKVCRESLRAKRSYPIRVSPVLNMAIFRGTTSKCRVFRLGKFFYWRKDNKSAKEKPCIR